MLSRGRAGSVLSIPQVTQDLSSDLGFGDEGDDAELASAVRTNKRVGQVDAPDQMSPSFSQCGPFLWREGGLDLFWENPAWENMVGNCRNGFA